jgi:AraC family transcriptional regulator
MDELGIRRGLRFLEDHLRKTFIMESAARAAGYSLYHFCRLFSLAAGQPPGEYIRKRRLSEAARELAETDKLVGRIAREYAFQSHEAFTRSFKALFGVSPEQYRHRTEPARLMKPFLLMEDVRISDPDHLSGPPEIVVLGETRVAGLRLLCDLTSPALASDILDHWERSAPRLRAAAGGVYPARRYGIGWPAEGRIAEPVLEYLAGIEWTGAAPPPGFRTFRIPAGAYLRAVHRGAPAFERETFLYLYGAYLPASNLDVREAFDFDVYAERFHADSPDDPDSEVEIYIPVRHREDPPRA